MNGRVVLAYLSLNALFYLNLNDLYFQSKKTKTEQGDFLKKII